VSGELLLRREPVPADPAAVRSIVTGSGFFRPQEVEVAVELVEERLAKGEASGYHFLFADLEGAVAGYACFGEIPATEGSWDLYWIAVDDARRGQGLGRQLLAAVEREVAGAGGRRLFIETSATALYQPTQAFYRRCGYLLEATLADFYRPGDAKLVYGKHLQP
jgi:D-alanine-D-alanine ligase